MLFRRSIVSGVMSGRLDQYPVLRSPRFIGERGEAPQVDFAPSRGGEYGGVRGIDEMAGEDGEGFTIVLVGHVVGVVPEDLGGFDFHIRLCGVRDGGWDNKGRCFSRNSLGGSCWSFVLRFMCTAYSITMHC